MPDVIDFLTPPPSERSAGSGRTRSRKPRLARYGMRLFGHFLHSVHQWLHANRSRVSKVYLVQEDDRFRLFVCAKTPAYDYELTELLVKFTAPFAGRGMHVSVAQIPDGTTDELAAYFKPAGAFSMTPAP